MNECVVGMIARVSIACICRVPLMIFRPSCQAGSWRAGGQIENHAHICPYAVVAQLSKSRRALDAALCFGGKRALPDQAELSLVEM